MRKHAGHHLNADGTLDECAREMLAWIEDRRIAQITREVEPVVIEASRRGCGTRLTLYSGWFGSVEIDESIPKNILELVER